ncbi:serine/threonine protein kinase [Nocardiopsis sp. HNM0947]|uniref:non-specific serine/threonine protein kinase n=1 Tax=Nocardiopsis coralli TaxID=2772213 RepID=A0ABR9PAQ1_9ACTN|nr:serine/threonine protein kinase [Nocardiopsis coralli]
MHRSDATQIFAAVRETSGIDAAVKVIAKPERARREISTLRTLADAPGVVPLMDAGRTTMGHEFLVLPLYPDGSLGQVLGRNGPSSLRQTVAVGRSVGAALANLHSKGLLHNAVAPENILAGSTSLLTGFSAVIRAGDDGVPVRSTESFLHAPPEAFRGERLVPSSDVYRLASTLWTMLMGRTPFSRENGAPLDNAAYMERVASMDAPRVDHQDVSRVLSRILTRAMAKAPEDRYQNAGEFAHALERARTGTTGTGGSPVSLSTRPSEAPPSPVVPPAPVPEQQVEQGPGPVSRREQRERFPEPESSEKTPAREAPPEPRPDHAPATVRHNETVGWSDARPNTTTDDGPELRADDAVEASVATSSSTSTIGPVPAQWKALEGWSGDSGTRLPGGGPGQADARQDDPVWNDLDEEPRWRKHLNIAVAASGVLLFTGAVGIVMAAQPDIDGSALASVAEPTEEEAADQENTEDPVPVEPSPPPAIDEPTEVVLDDNGNSVTLNWSDNSGGTASYFVLGGQQDHDPSTLARTGPGAVTTQVNTEVPNSEYCFTVIAVDGTAAPADEVCTTRAADRAEAERQAEEEAEEEREEEEDEDAADGEEDEDDSSGSGGGGSGSDDSGSGGSGSGGSGSSGGSGD